MAGTWQSIAARKQKERDSRIPPAWRLHGSPDCSLLDIPRQSGILTDLELRITEQYDATGLLAELAKGTLKSEQVVQAFCKRAAIAHQVTNCLTEILFREAIQRAQELDRIFEKTGKLTGPLHGLPISLKDVSVKDGRHSMSGTPAHLPPFALDRRLEFEDTMHQWALRVCASSQRLQIQPWWISSCHWARFCIASQRTTAIPPVWDIS